MVDTKREVAVRVSAAELDALREGLELLREQLESTVRNEPPDKRAAMDAARQLHVVAHLEATLDEAG